MQIRKETNKNVKSFCHIISATACVDQTNSSVMILSSPNLSACQFAVKRLFAWGRVNTSVWTTWPLLVYLVIWVSYFWVAKDLKLIKYVCKFIQARRICLKINKFTTDQFLDVFERELCVQNFK